MVINTVMHCVPPISLCVCRAVTFESFVIETSLLVSRYEQNSDCLCLPVLCIQEWLDTQCQDTVYLATQSTWLLEWNQLEKVVSIAV